jgi:transposase
VCPTGRLRLHQNTHATGRAIAEEILDSFTSCPIREVTRLGRTLTQRRTEFLGYFDTGGANNGGTEAINGLIETPSPHRPRLPQPDTYRLRMLLIGDGLPL